MTNTTVTYEVFDWLLEHIHDEELCGPILKISEEKERRLRLAGHCHRHPEMPASKVELTHGRRDPGRPAKTLLSILMEDAEVESREEQHLTFFYLCLRQCNIVQRDV